MGVIDEAKAIRSKYQELLVYAPDDKVFGNTNMFDAWRISVEYIVGVRVRYNDTLYRCLQTHISQETWSPDVAVSLWVRIDDPAIQFPEWRQPTGSADAYPIDATVSYNSLHWKSTVANNVWAPDTYGWVQI